MAMTMAAASSIDLKVPATYNIRLGSTISKSTEPKSYLDVRYNHKPDGSASKAILHGRGSNGAVELALQDGKDEYLYSGEGRTIEDTFVLVIKDKEATLEQVQSSYVFNLTSSPESSNTKELRARHPQLNVEEDAKSRRLGANGSVEDEGAEADNPYDYRHFLKAAAEQKAGYTGHETARSSAATPLLHARPASSTPVARPVKRNADSALMAQKKRKAPISSTTVSAPKRVKPDSDSTTTAKPTTAKTVPSTNLPPRIRVDRKASVRPESQDDDGELILENDEISAGSKLPSKRSAMSMALSGQLGQGPISLRSAASSPASVIASPAPIRPHEADEDMEFELGGPSSPGEALKQPSNSRRLRTEDEEPPGLPYEEDEDADVEDLELPSPAAGHKPSVSATTVTAGDEDDLDAQLAAAMAEEDGPADAEEDEESEEE
jgi:hypothetical protein